MLSKINLLSLKQKLFILLAGSLVIRLFIFFVLPSSSTLLAPDEATYASLTKWIGKSKPADQFPSFGGGLYLSGRSIIVPASLLYRMGVGELDSVRLISTLYGLLGLVLVIGAILRFYKENPKKILHGKFNENLIVGLVFIYAFLPSHFLWSNLGLRESATEFWILASFITFFVICNFHKKLNPLQILCLVVSISFTFSARPQVGWVLGVSMIAYLLFYLRQINSYFIASFIVCGVLAGSLLSNGSTLSTFQTSSTASTASTSELFTRLFHPLVSSGELITSKQVGNQIGAESVIETQNCPRETTSPLINRSSKIDTYFCIAWRAPYMISTFLFRPIIGIDVTSSSSLMAAVENLIWMSAFAILLILIIRKRHWTPLKTLLPSIIFFMFYVTGASAYQGNMGTGFRHKSLILWVVLLVLFDLVSKKPLNPNKIRGLNRQKARFN